jgi:hypothetical protein
MTRINIVHLGYHWEGLEVTASFRVLSEGIDDTTPGAESFASGQAWEGAIQ